MRALLPVLLILTSGCAAAPSHLPTSVAVLGDSISRGVNAESPGERLADSWATGSADGLRSFAQRLNATAAYNDAQSGAGVADLAAQARSAVAQKPELVLVLIGANDACRANASAMTSVDGFRAAFDDAARTLRDGLPRGATVYVLSIPDVHRLWVEERSSSYARALWRAERACPTLLGDNATDDERAAAGARIEAYDAALAEESAKLGFATDGGAVHDAPIASEDLSRVDAFHPSLAGQRALAAVAWDAGPFAHR